MHFDNTVLNAKITWIYKHEKIHTGYKATCPILKTSKSYDYQLSQIFHENN